MGALFILLLLVLIFKGDSGYRGGGVVTLPDPEDDELPPMR